MPPDFLGIGAQKAATTWLDHNLREHPGIWLPPVKELHYFTDRAHGLPGGTFRRFFARDWANRRLRSLLWSRLRADLRYIDLDGLRWDLRYFFGTRDDRWYLSLFEGGGSKVKGEITPAYSTLEKSEVRQIHELLPDLRLLLLLRDPIDRSWSQLRHLARQRGERVEEMDPDSVLALIETGLFTRRSNYPRILEHWGAYYPAERLFVAFIEDVIERPRELLLEIFRFLGLDSAERSLSNLAEERIHTKGRRSPPPYLVRRLAALHMEELRELEKLLGGPTTRWRERAEKILGGVV